VLDGRVNVELVRWENDAPQGAANVRPDDAEQRSCDPTHWLFARHEEARNQADDQTKND
jgi:hypothetical protein